MMQNQIRKEKIKKEIDELFKAIFRLINFIF